MKVAIVVLILVAALFAVALGLGFRKEPRRSEEKEKAKKGEAPGWAQSMDGPAKSRMPGVKLNKERIEVTGESKFVIEKADVPFRLLRLAHESGGNVAVEFRAKEPPPKTGDEEMDPQEFTLSHIRRDSAKEYVETAVVIFKSGGTLKLSPAPKAGTPYQKGVVRVQRRPMPSRGRLAAS